MGRDSRSPKRGHHRSSHRERESKHKKHRKTSRESRGSGGKHREHDKNEHDYRPDTAPVKRYDTTQRGIDAARNRLRASLGTAISDMRDTHESQKAGTSKAASYDFSDSASVIETMNRQKLIENIEQPGFTPAQFISGSKNQAVDNKSAKATAANESADIKVHERAIFGALWTSREIEKKLAKQEGLSTTTMMTSSVVNVKDEYMEVDEEPRDDETTRNEEREDVKPVQRAAAQGNSLAHERLSADPAAREAKWLKIFRLRRKALIEGH